jgi:hypothetical protein
MAMAIPYAVHPATEREIEIRLYPYIYIHLLIVGIPLTESTVIAIGGGGETTT